MKVMYKFYIETGLGLSVNYVKENDFNKAIEILEEKNLDFKYKKVLTK